MNTITVLLGATGLLLVTAVVLSFTAMNKKSDDAEQAEMAKLRAEIAALEEQQKGLNAPAPHLLGAHSPFVPAPVPGTPTTVFTPAPSPSPVVSVTPNPPAPAPAPTPTPGLVDPITGDNGEVPSLGDDAEIAKLKAELERERLAHQTLLAEQEQGLIPKPMLEADRKHQARASTVRAALLQAKVVEWVPEDVEDGGFAVIDIRRNDLLNGTVLGIRRQSGIYGHLKVVHIYPERGKAAANPVVGTFPEGAKPDVKPGDELIIPPL